MSRPSLNITMTAPLMRANLRQRLDRLAQRTDLPATTVAARALLFGLAHVESDLSLLFTGAAEPTLAEGSPPATAAALSNAAVLCDAEQCAAHSPLPIATACTAQETASAPQDTASNATDKPAPAVTADDESAPRAKQADLITTKDAAAALGKSRAAFSMHLQRHPELRRYSRKVDGAVLWDVAKLRAAWAK